MCRRRLIHQITLAFCLSIGMLLAAVGIHSTLLFPAHFQNACLPDQPQIIQFSAMADGQPPIGILRVWPRTLLHEPQFILQKWQAVGRTLSSQRIDVGVSPRVMACAPDANRVFVSSNSGELYFFELTGVTPRPQFLTRCDGFRSLLTCTHDGSLLIAGSHHGLIAWDPETTTRLWQRSDIEVSAAHLSGNRLFCGLDAGPCLELDQLTGATLRTVDTRKERIISLTVSADAKYLATQRYHGLCTVADVQVGEELWSKRIPEPGVAPRFSPDGQAVLIAAPARAPVVHVVSAATGHLLAELHGAKAEIAGIDVTNDGIVYAWDTSGTLSVWDLTTRQLLHQRDLTS